MIRIERTHSENSDFQKLAAELSAFLSILNGEQDSFYAANNKVDGIPTVVVAYEDDRPVGCGAFRARDVGGVEIKRMFVLPELRGQSIGGQILAELEQWAIELGHVAAVLETSKRLISALRLYTRSGYHVIPNYPPYEAVEDSVCMAKSLA